MVRKDHLMQHVHMQEIARTIEDAAYVKVVGPRKANNSITGAR